jgi:hypothetical protein
MMLTANAGNCRRAPFNYFCRHRPSSFPSFTGRDDNTLRRLNRVTQQTTLVDTLPSLGSRDRTPLPLEDKPLADELEVAGCVDCGNDVRHERPLPMLAEI